MNNNISMMQQILNNLNDQSLKLDVLPKEALMNNLEARLAYYPNPYNATDYNPNLKRDINFQNYKETLRRNPKYETMFWSNPENLNRLNSFNEYRNMYYEANEADPDRKIKEILWEVNPHNIYENIKNSEVFYKDKE